MRRNPALAASVVACVAALAAIPGARAGSAADPGISLGSILLGTTAPLTGEGADGAAVARGVKAYFAHVNARGGVAGRRFAYAIADDGGDPATTEEETRQLVEQEGVFAIVAPAGTEQSLAARRYLNTGNVPQLFVASGATTWGRDRRVSPWSIGFQPSYQAEGWVYGRYVARALERAKVAVLYEGEGRDLLRGLRRGLAGSGSKVVAALPYGRTASVQPEVVRLRASGADVLAIFAAPLVAAQAYSQLRRSGWKPRVLVNADAATVSTVPEGSISLAFLKDPADPQWKDDPGMRLYRALMRRYARGADARDVRHVQGMAVAYETVALFERLASTPTRAKLMANARSITSVGNPFLLPGVAVRTSRTDGFPVQQGRLQRYAKGRWVPFGGLWSAS